MFRMLGTLITRCPPGASKARELADSLVRIFDVLEPLEARDVLKFGVGIRQWLRRDRRDALRCPGSTEDIRVQVAGLHMESRFGEARESAPSPAGTSSNFPRGSRIENPRYGLVDFRTSNRRRRAAGIHDGGG